MKITMWLREFPDFMASGGISAGYQGLGANAQIRGGQAFLQWKQPEIPSSAS